MTMNEEEREVLKSIYESDPNFSIIDENTFQYKFVLDNDRFYLVEIRWPENYPDVIPTIHLDSFSNRLLTPEFKSKLIEKFNNDANEQVGMPMTYTLFESIKDFSYDGDIFQSSLVSNTGLSLITTNATTNTASSSTPTTAIKKEQLTKAQKRRQWNNRLVGEDGQKARGHDWVDIIRHLSQTGNKIES